MRYIALEEAFSIPELEARQPALPDRGRFKPEYEDAWSRKLADFTEFRLPEIGATGMDMQVLSLTIPGLQADVAAGVAADDARFATDYLASVAAEHPTRFAALAALPMQDTAAAVAELDRCVSILGFCGALINNCLQGHYLAEQQFGHQFSRQRPGGYSGP